MKLIAILITVAAFNVSARTGDVSYEFETMIQSKKLEKFDRYPNSLNKDDHDKKEKEKEVSVHEVGPKDK